VILTHDAELARVLRALRNHGQTEPSCHDYCGTTGRLDEIHAGILHEKLKHFEDFLRARRRAASLYIEGLRDLPLGMPKDVSGATTAPNLFVVRTSARTELRQYLMRCGIATGIHYPIPLHKVPAFRDQPWSEVVLPETESLCSEILSLPLWVGISEDEQLRVIEALRNYFGSTTRWRAFSADSLSSAE
jgi:dTDP-4-amino-4,6-dideoxygalactose transaminase